VADSIIRDPIKRWALYKETEMNLHVRLVIDVRRYAGKARLILSAKKSFPFYGRELKKKYEGGAFVSQHLFILFARKEKNAPE
jgi:hypothetical protein